MRKPPEPSKFVGVKPDDPRVGHRPLTEIEKTIGTERHHVRVVVARTRQAVDDDGFPATEIQAADTAGRSASETHRAPSW